MMGKGENDVNPTFFPHYGFMSLRQRCHNTELYCKALTLSHTTNFALFQTERVCRRQFQI